jgi:hypothetical protein
MRGLALFLLACIAPSFAEAGGQPAFVGTYGHGATALPDDVVWIVQQAGDHWRVVQVADGAASDAHRLQRRGRDAFWARMDWPEGTGAEADCLSWGEKPGSLEDLLSDVPPVPSAPGEDYGHALLCHVPQPSRARIAWLADNTSDWFYYDPVFGVIEVRALR